MNHLLKLVKVMLIITVCLSGCDQQTFSQEQLVGIWQTSEFKEDLTLDITLGSGVEIYFTDDFNVYVRFLQETTAGVLADSFQYKYEIADSKLKLEFIENQSYVDIPHFDITVKDNKIVLNVKGDGKDFTNRTTSYILNKKSEYVPYGYTDADKQEILDKNKKIKQDIRACVQKYSAALNLDIIECGEYSYYSGGHFIGGVEHGIIFKIEDIDVCITLSVLAKSPWGDGYYIEADAGCDAMVHAIPCIVSGDFALVYDEEHKPPEEWLNTFMILYP